MREPTDHWSKIRLGVLIAKSVNSNAVVHIVESNKSLLEKINKLNIANVTAFSSFKEYISSVKSQKYDYVRIDRVNFNLDLVAQLYSKHNISSICGELKEADCKPLTLYRLSRNSCDSFSLISRIRITMSQEHVSVSNSPKYL